MSLSDEARRRLAIAMANPGAGKELADAVDASTIGLPTVGGNNTFTGNNTFSGNVAVQKLNLGPAPTDTFAATMTIDVTKSSHIIAASHTTSATLALTPSAAGTAGDMLTIITETDSSGTVTTTFASTFHSSGTQACTSSTFSSITFQSDGTRWVEMCRTTALS